MAGLLDFLDSDEGRLGLGLLMAGGQRSDGAGFGQRISEGMNYAKTQKDNDGKRKFQQAQIDNYASEIEARKLATIKDQRAQQNDAMFMGLGGGQPSGGGGSVYGAGGAPSGGGAQESDGFTAEAISKRFGIPREAIQADYRMNGGKKIAEFISERSKPNWQNINGNLVNTNEQGFGGGLQAGMASSANGNVNVWQPDGRGGLVVGAPSGALKTTEAYALQAARIASMGRVNMRKNADGTESPIPESSENTALFPGGGQRGPVQPGYATEPQMKATMAGDMGADPKALTREIKSVQNDLMKPIDEGSKAMLRSHLADLQRQASDPRLGAQSAPTPASGAPAYGMTNDQAAQADATKTQLTSQAKDVAEQRKTIMSSGFNAPTTIAKYQQIGKLLDGVDGGTLTATGTQLASTMNSIGIKVDKNLPNKEAAAALGNEMALELRNPANGAGMPGAMSDADRNYLVSMIPNASQSSAGRKQLIEAKILTTQRNQDVANFARNYEKKYGKLDNGFFDQMSAWATENPLFKAK